MVRRWSSLQLGIHVPPATATVFYRRVNSRVWIPDYSNNTPTDNLHFVQSKKTWPMIGNQLTFHVLSAEGDIKELFAIASGKQPNDRLENYYQYCYHYLRTHSDAR